VRGCLVVVGLVILVLVVGIISTFTTLALCGCRGSGL